MKLNDEQLHELKDAIYEGLVDCKNKNFKFETSDEIKSTSSYLYGFLIGYLGLDK